MFVVFMDFVVVEKWYNIGNLSIVPSSNIYNRIPTHCSKYAFPRKWVKNIENGTFLCLKNLWSNSTILYIDSKTHISVQKSKKSNRRSVV